MRAERPAGCLSDTAPVVPLVKYGDGSDAVLSISYVVLVVLPSRFFLGEALDAIKIAGIVLAMFGAGLLSWRSS